jgi:hypothetical protein
MWQGGMIALIRGVSARQGRWLQAEISGKEPGSKKVK